MMIKRSRSELNLTAKQTRRYERRRESKPSQKENRKMNPLVKSLESTLHETHTTKLKSSLKKAQLHQMDEAKKENKQLLNVLQQQCSNHDLGRSDISPAYSTVSMVHLQYKYEELLSSHEGLLKLLETKVMEVRKCYIENENLHNEIKTLKNKHEDMEKSVRLVCEKYLKLKQRKERKICKVKFERDTIKLAHDKLVHLLHRKCMEEDDLMGKQLCMSMESSRSLLISEVRRANKLQYDNAMLLQQNEFLHAKLQANFNFNKNKE
ncbi:uncharacterized protein [Atheta coriaria]|uniref:uncharacterized protein n=1 Tax=Dalotia coriaria TaxID=877792 RepID=UPI0031F33A44